MDNFESIKDNTQENHHSCDATKLRTWARNLSGAALIAMQIISCSPSFHQKKINKPKNKIGWADKSLKRLKENNDALGRASFSFHKDPEMVCVSGDRGVLWIRKLYRKLLKSWAERNCPHKRQIIFDETARKGEHPPQCIACDDPL